MIKDTRLAQYSAFAISFLLMKEADGEAVYTDIDPDTVINLDGEHGYIDMDNDGTDDFRFFKFTGTRLTYWSDYFSYSSYLFAAPQNLDNAIAGVKAVIDPSYGGFTIYYPFALEYGDPINDTINFYNQDFQALAFIIDGDFSPSDVGGKWFPERIDHYVGVRFLDSQGCNHYGWIRCDVRNGSDTLIIKDYAYENKCNIGILAGDTIGDTTTVDIEEINSIDATVYSFGDNIYVSYSDPESAKIHVYDITGRLIYSQVLAVKFLSITLQTSGNYFVELISEKGRYIKKVFIR